MLFRDSLKLFSPIFEAIDKLYNANSKKVTYPAYDAFASSVVATFNLRNAKSNEIVLSRKGAYTNVSGSKNKQATVYDTICTAFCKQYKSTIKQIKKLKKENKISQ